IFIFDASIVAAVGFFLIVPAVIVFVGAIVIRRYLARRTDLLGGGMASAAIKISGAAIVLDAALIFLLPSLGHTGSSPRGNCMANLRGIMQSMQVYTYNNNDRFPL